MMFRVFLIWPLFSFPTSSLMALSLSTLLATLAIFLLFLEYISSLLPQGLCTCCSLALSSTCSSMSFTLVPFLLSYIRGHFLRNLLLISFYLNTLFYILHSNLFSLKWFCIFVLLCDSVSSLSLSQKECKPRVDRDVSVLYTGSASPARTSEAEIILQSCPELGQRSQDLHPSVITSVCDMIVAQSRCSITNC